MKEYRIKAKDGTHTCTQLKFGHFRCDLLKHEGDIGKCDECDEISSMPTGAVFRVCKKYPLCCLD